MSQTFFKAPPGDCKITTLAGILHLNGSKSLEVPAIDWSAKVVLYNEVLFKLPLLESSGSNWTKKDRLNSTKAKAERAELTVLKVSDSAKGSTYISSPVLNRASTDLANIFTLVAPITNFILWNKEILNQQRIRQNSSNGQILFIRTATMSLIYYFKDLLLYIIVSSIRKNVQNKNKVQKRNN